MQRLKYALPGLAISALAGAAGNYFFDLNFWVAASMVAASLTLNGLIAGWEDRGNFNDWWAEFISRSSPERGGGARGEA